MHASQVSLIDSPALSAWLSTHVPQIGAISSIERFVGGQSNPTFAVTTSAGRFVLRRKPAGPLLKGAHAVEREARVQTALHDAGFPVARVVATCDDPAVIGSPFYLMTLVEGRLFWDSTFASADRAERAALFDAMNTTIARLHAVDPIAVGLADYGRADRYLERQVARWSTQYREDAAAGHLPELDAVAAWLPTAVPPDGAAAIVHGDFRVDNLIFAPDRPDVLAVIDWELSTIGDPIADFAYHLMMYHLPPSFPGGLLGIDLTAHGLPDEAAYVASYTKRTGKRGDRGARRLSGL